MSLGIHTQYKFRHYVTDPDTGERMLTWASDGLDRSEDGLWVPKGSSEDLDIRKSQRWNLNILANEGKQDILNVYFDVQAVRTNLYGRLWNDTPVETDGMGDLTGEVAGTGYGAVTFARGTDWSAPTDADPSSTDTTAATKTFTAGGTWSSATYITLDTTGTAATGQLIAYSALSATRTLQNGDTLDVDFTVTLDST